MRITVTDKHIFDSLLDDNAPCPIQIAMQESFGVRVLVGPEDAVVGSVRYKLPRAAKKFIQRFDGDGAVSGFEFEIGGHS